MNRRDPIRVLVTDDRPVVRSILRRLEVSNRTEAVTITLQRGVIRLDG
jgi:hypothetical protein